MKKIVLVYGSIAGLIVGVVLAYATIVYVQTNKYPGSMLIGYASMLVAFSIIFVAVKTFRDKYNRGIISFGKALKIGFLISLIASTIYVIVWLISFYGYMPDFMDKYADQMISDAKAKGSTAAEIAKISSQMDSYREMYKNPLFVILLTYMEILPVGLIVSVISALILKRKMATPVLA